MAALAPGLGSPRRQSPTATDADGPADPAVSDHSLLQSFSTGSEAAAVLMYERYAARLRALVRAKLSPILNGRLDADDVVQSVFRRFFLAAGRGNYDVPEGKDL